MMYKYFKNVDSLELGQLRQQYRDLIKRYHPDNTNGNTAACQEVNAEYNKIFKILQDKHTNSTTDSSSTNNATYDFEIDKKLREIIDKIIGFESINIDIVGNWIWLDGNTYPYKDRLKELGFRWSGQRKKWYWHEGEYKKHSSKKLSYEEIQNYFGSTKVQTRQKEILEIE